MTIDGAGGAVEQEVDGALGASVTPCSSASSDHWYFAAGRTDTDATMLVSLYNPFPVEAIADLRFATDQGPTTPDAYQGVVVPARGSLVLNIGDRVRFNHHTRPQYLRGVEGTVIELDHHTATVCVHQPIGRFKRGESHRCPPLLLDRLQPAA